MRGSDWGLVPLHLSLKVNVGVMIKALAAVVLADTLAREADFFSLETSDLTQRLLLRGPRQRERGRTLRPDAPGGAARHPIRRRRRARDADSAGRAAVRWRRTPLEVIVLLGLG
ncbi:MAG: putative PEP-binding protein [Blastocatellia bacterium]